MPNVLLSWIGNADLKGAGESPPSGPLLRIVASEPYDALYLLHNQPSEQLQALIREVANTFSGSLVLRQVSLTSPIHFGDIYQAFDAVMAEAVKEHPKGHFTIQLSSGTPAMAAVSILIGKAKYPARFIQSSREQGVQEEELPFDIAADFLPALAERSDNQLKSLMAGLAPSTAAFNDIVSQNPHMEQLKQRAAVLAQRNVPVLIYGETGTGKELFARAIHNSSPRADKAFLTLNCGTIPPDLIDSTLFGHTKGSFTGASADHRGYFEQADSGTLFLDEFGELPLNCQVRLLRVLQEGTLAPVGSTKERRVDVRVIAATNKNLVDEVAAGRFREDLFYRVAIGVLNLPPLRDRAGDLVLLADTLLEQINHDAAGQTAHIHKKFSAKAKKFIQSYRWPGNVRELYATLLRASLWKSAATLTDADIKGALLDAPDRKEQILGRSLSKGIDIHGVVSEVCAHYIGRALQQSSGNKSEAAEMLGLKNYQTLSNWMEKYGVE